MLMNEPVLMTCPLLKDQPHTGRPTPTHADGPARRS
jgi:hypothetical protein